MLKENDRLELWQSGPGSWIESLPIGTLKGATRGWEEGQGSERDQEPKMKCLPVILPRAPTPSAGLV